MDADLKQVEHLRQQFEAELKSGKTTPAELIKDSRLKQLLADISLKPAETRRAFGQAVNELKSFLLEKQAAALEEKTPAGRYLDVTAPCDINQAWEKTLFSPEDGSLHPILKAQDEMVGIFTKMGFTAVESKQLDNDFYMFDSLNFPQNHPARDEFDTFYVDGRDQNDRPLLAPAHTSVMQNRVLRRFSSDLSAGLPIAVVIPGRVFRKEDVDPTHDHMFYQLEGVYVGAAVTVANLIAVLKESMSAYFEKEISLKIQPSYFPFTEPSFEFAISCPFCPESAACRVCGSGGWIELLGCGMIHPNVLKSAGIDPSRYSGFAWGIGLTRLTMIKHDIEDIRHFASGKLEFLRQFGYEG